MWSALLSPQEPPLHPRPRVQHPSLWVLCLLGLFPAASHSGIEVGQFPPKLGLSAGHMVPKQLLEPARLLPPRPAVQKPGATAGAPRRALWCPCRTARLRRCPCHSYRSFTERGVHFCVSRPSLWSLVVCLTVPVEATFCMCTRQPPPQALHLLPEARERWGNQGVGGQVMTFIISHMSVSAS